MDKEQVFARVEENTREGIKEHLEALKNQQAKIKEQTVSEGVQAWCDEKEKKPFAGKQI